MSKETWIVVRNWDKFQHYHDRRPVWIKVYTELESLESFRALSYAERGLLMSLWITYSNARGVLSVHSVGSRTGQKTRSQHLQALADAGFISFSASKPTEMGAMPEKRREREEKKDLKTPTAQNGQPRRPSREEVPAMIDVVTACQHFIAGQAWDETFDENAMLEEFGRIQRGRRTTGILIGAELNALVEQWKAERQDRYGIKANLH